MWQDGYNLGDLQVGDEFQFVNRYTDARYEKLTDGPTCLSRHLQTDTVYAHSRYAAVELLKEAKKMRVKWVPHQDDGRRELVSLRQGECFVRDMGQGTVYMRCNPIPGSSVNAVELYSGTLCKFRNEERVIPVHATMRVTKYV